MRQNEELIHNFYEFFKRKDYLGMQNCYDENAVFSDEVFIGLNVNEVRAMWEMLITRGKDLVLDFKNVNANDTSGSAEWQATYTFSKTRRKVINKISAQFVIKDGKIVSHIDKFDFYKWNRQAFGAVGLLLGWTGFFKKKVQAQAKIQLTHFMGAKVSQSN